MAERTRARPDNVRSIDRLSKDNWILVQRSVRGFLHAAGHSEISIDTIGEIIGDFTQVLRDLSIKHPKGKSGIKLEVPVELPIINYQDYTYDPNERKLSLIEDEVNDKETEGNKVKFQTFTTMQSRLIQALFTKPEGRVAHNFLIYALWGNDTTVVNPKTVLKTHLSHVRNGFTKVSGTLGEKRLVIGTYFGGYAIGTEERLIKEQGYNPKTRFLS